MEQIKESISSFQEAFKKYQSDEEALSEAAEPDFCECGNQIFLDEASMEIGSTYCDRNYQYVKSQTERKYKELGKEIRYIPSLPVMCCIGPCPIPALKAKQGEVQKIQSEYSEMSFEKFDYSLQSIPFDACKEFDGNGKLILAGRTGIGKTHLARATYLNLLPTRECIWFKAPDLAELFRRIQSFNDDWKDRQLAQNTYELAMKADCIFIDDLGTERATESDLFNEQFKVFLENIRGGFVITTNLDSTGIMRRYHEKITSRLLEHARTIVMIGEDFRRRSFPKTKLEPKQQELKA